MLSLFSQLAYFSIEFISHKKLLCDSIFSKNVTKRDKIRNIDVSVHFIPFIIGIKQTS